MEIDMRSSVLSFPHITKKNALIISGLSSNHQIVSSYCQRAYILNPNGTRGKCDVSRQSFNLQNTLSIQAGRATISHVISNNLKGAQNILLTSDCRQTKNIREFGRCRND